MLEIRLFFSYPNTRFFHPIRIIHLSHPFIQTYESASDSFHTQSSSQFCHCTLTTFHAFHYIIHDKDRFSEMMLNRNLNFLMSPSGCLKPLPLPAFFLVFQVLSNPASLRMRQLTGGLTTMTFSSSMRS